MSSALHNQRKIWAIVPAAGIGKRMLSEIPKQYLPLNGLPVIQHTVNALLNNDYISGLFIALQQGDNYWSQVKVDSSKPIIRVEGGAERSDSVLNALSALIDSDDFTDTDWVMVHDAVRPCLVQADIKKLVSEISSEDGGLLALPVRDTMKRQNTNGTVNQTVDRENLWQALTPQFFPALSLKQALENARDKQLNITDESSAMELAGYSPKLISGREDNIKITRPDDLRLAGMYLQAQ